MHVSSLLSSVTEAVPFSILVTTVSGHQNKMISSVLSKETQYGTYFSMHACMHGPCGWLATFSKKKTTRRRKPPARESGQKARTRTECSREKKNRVRMDGQWSRRGRGASIRLCLHHKTCQLKAAESSNDRAVALGSSGTGRGTTPALRKKIYGEDSIGRLRRTTKYYTPFLGLGFPCT
jgi:hypothetical protein